MAADSLLILDFPGRRPEAHISEMGLDQHGFSCTEMLTSPMPVELDTRAYAAELHRRHQPDRPLALIAYCATAPLAVAMAELLAGPDDPVPIVLLDPQRTPPAEFLREYREVVRQVEGRVADAERLPLLSVEPLLATPGLLVEHIGLDLRERARQALASYGFTGDDVNGPVEGLVGVYVEWLTFLVAAHHDKQPSPRGPVLQVISRGHPADADWLGATGLRTVRVPCDRPELAVHDRARTAITDFLRHLTLPSPAGPARG